MCNIAGYVGSRQAAPILVEMMKKQEGWDAGYYTGLATIDGGHLRMDKVVGDTAQLLKETQVLTFPGNIGIMHGRSRSAGSREWSHPFLGTGGKIAYVANGCRGAYGKKCPGGEEIAKRREDLYMQMKAAGYVFPSSEDHPVGSYPVMPDGNCCHTSDSMCQSITYFADQGMTTAQAIERSFCEVPSEFVGLALNLDEPDCVHWGRINYPMFLGRADHGTYLATTPTAFPEDVQEVTLLPVMSAGRVFADGYEATPFAEPPGTVAPMKPELWQQAFEKVEALLSQGEMDHDSLDRMLKEFFEPATCVQEAALDYEIMYRLQQQGRLKIRVTRVPHPVADLTAPKFYASIG